MKSSQFLTMSLLTAVLFFSSCNGTEEKTKTDKTGSDTTKPAPTTEPAPASTIVTTPQDMMLVRHKVSNFTKWKASYEAHDSMRLAGGLHSYVIGRSVKDSNMVLVSVKADDIAKAKAFAKDPSLKQAMQKGGVTGTPSFIFTTMTFQDTATISSDIRSLTTFAVKDWGAWEKAFADGKQERIDNGLVVRAYGHQVDDGNKVTLVTAVMDTAKASAYWKSDMLKKRRAASGVIGEPERFVFRIVQRY
jgi:hypothetical protein